MFSTDEAKLKQVSGWDVYFSEHIGYLNEVNQNWVVNQLCSQGILFACDSTLLKLKDGLKEEAKLWANFLASGGILGRDPMPSNQFALHQLRHWRLDCFKLGASFESALKARLLRKGYLLHELTAPQESLAARQRNKPIEISEFKSLVAPMHNGRYNFFPALKEKTLSFDTLLKKEAYLKVLALPDQHLQFFNELRRLRNLIHLPLVGEHVATPLLSSLGSDFSPFLARCLNEYLIKPHNETSLPGREEPSFSESP